MKCYAIILSAWCTSKSRGSEIQAEEILHRMVQVYRQGLSGSGSGSSGNHQMVRYYNNVMNRIANSGKTNAGSEAERLLNDLIGLYYKQQEEENGEKDDARSDSRSSSPTKKLNSRTVVVAPDRNTFNTVIKAYVNAGGGSSKDACSTNNINRILQMMEDPSILSLPNSIARQIKPDKITYTSIIMGLAANNNNNDKDAGKKAEEILQRMIDMSRNDNDDNRDVKPDTVTYNAVLKVW